jgi:hypothetical protein
MKFLLFLTITLGGLLMLTPASYANGTLVQVEKLTPEEQAELLLLENKVKEAHQNLTNLKNRIAKDHRMENQRWVEWQPAWYEIDGNYILLRRQSFMPAFRLEETDHPPKFNLNDGKLEEIK